MLPFTLCMDLARHMRTGPAIVTADIAFSYSNEALIQMFAGVFFFLLQLYALNSRVSGPTSFGQHSLKS